MNYRIPLALFLLFHYNNVNCVNSTSKYAFLSVLSSDDFLLPAQVLANRLQKLNHLVPYIVIVTEDIKSDSIDILRKQGVIIEIDKKIDTPYIKTHKAKKYQYTKIRYWNITDYDVIVHLDLDVLPLVDISSLFHCGAFCAAFRHSDKFNSGVFVLKPNQTIFADMQRQVGMLESYDGGDQGFLNSYFDNLKYSIMFEGEGNNNACWNSSLKRLSSAYNYDIGMYYLNGGKLLLNPKIIHYTMGPTKPWIWWTYPLFDLNWIWYQARREMEKSISDTIEGVSIYLALYHSIFILFLILIKKSAEIIVGKKLSKNQVQKSETILISHVLYIFSLYFCMRITPPQAHPIPAWLFFISNTAWMTTILSSTYFKLRSGMEYNSKSLLICIFVILFSNLVLWITLASINSFSTRCKLLIVVIPLQQILLPYFIRNILSEHCIFRKLDYQKLRIIH